jgi:hypothetical protein
LDEPARAAVSTITASIQSVHVLTIGADADKHAALTAVSAAARGQGKHVLALPATDTAAAYAEHHTYAQRFTDPASTRQRIDNGQWTIPPGTLFVIDDADQLAPKLLRFFTDHAARSNTKLLLIHTPTKGRTPAHSLIDALAETLPWAQKLGTPATGHTTAMDRARANLAEHEPLNTEDRDAADLLARRDTLQQAYQAKFKPRLHNTTEHTHAHELEI